MSSDVSYAVTGIFATWAADARRESRQSRHAGDGNAARKLDGRARYFAKAAKRAEGRARRERKVEMRRSL